MIAAETRKVQRVVARIAMFLGWTSLDMTDRVFTAPGRSSVH
jgi:hypothetical protein